MTGAAILGANSGVARALARRLASTGVPVVLAARDPGPLADDAADIRLRTGVDAHPIAFDALAFDSHDAFLDRADAALGGRLDTLVLCYGDMAEQRAAEADFALAHRMIDVNYTSAVSVLERAAARLVDRPEGGSLCALSSVAGDRGRQSNYIYGSSKAALTTYLQGLRNRLARRRVAVLTVKPGFVDTAMTWGLLKPDSPLVASPERVAADIERALRRGRNQIYTPWFWSVIMRIIRSIPEFLFKRLSL